MTDEQQVWTVTSQVEAFGIGPNGQPTNGVTVSFRTARGNVGSVFVPRSEYNVQRVRQLVGQQAAQMDAISMLTGA